MAEYKYLGQALTASCDNLKEVVTNIWKAWGIWEPFYRILGRDGADPWTSGSFNKAADLATLLFGSETWVMTPRIGKTLGGFRHRVARCLVETHTKRDTLGRWEYVPLDAETSTVGL